jgi:hypothetical protein
MTRTALAIWLALFFLLAQGAEALLHAPIQPGNSATIGYNAQDEQGLPSQMDFDRHVGLDGHCHFHGLCAAAQGLALITRANSASLPEKPHFLSALVISPPTGPPKI